MADDQVSPALDEIAQLVGIEGVRQARVYLQLHHPGSGEDFGGPDRLFVRDIGLEPAGLKGAQREHITNLADSYFGVRRESKKGLAALFHSPLRETLAIQVHDFVPGGDKVGNKLLLGVITGIDLGNRTELGVRTENEIDPGAHPFDLARGAIPSFEEALG